MAGEKDMESRTLTGSDQSAALHNPSYFLYGPENAKIQDHPVPQIDDPHDVLIRIAYTGVCGSDVHFWAHGGVGARKVSTSQPLIMGHEASGTVHTVGSAVIHIKPGDRIAIEPGFPCRRCRHCKDGTYNLCPEMTFAACPPDAHGTLTKYYRIPEDFCYKIPESMGLEEAVLVEPLSVAVHTVRLAGIKPGQSVVVFGSGSIGLLCAAVSKAFGAGRVVAVDIMDEKLQFAKGYIPGCGLFRPSTELLPEENAEAIITDHALGEGADAVLEASGAEASVRTGIHVLRPSGALVLVGLGKPELSSFPIMALSQKEVTVRGCFRYGPGDYQIALGLLETGKISVKELITSTLPFEQAPEAWEMTRKGIGMKNLIKGVRDESIYN